jgi:hypothetical protein
VIVFLNFEDKDMNLKECCIFRPSEDLVLEIEDGVVVCMPMDVAREVCILGSSLGHKSGASFIVIFYKSDFWAVNDSRIAEDRSGVYMRLASSPIPEQEDIKAEIRELLSVAMNAEPFSDATKH